MTFYCRTTTTLGMISFFYQLVSCFVLINLCSCYKVQDYVKMSTVGARNPPSSVANSDVSEVGVTRLWTIKLKKLDKLSTDDVKKKAEKIARELKMENLGQIGRLSGHYTFAAPNFNAEIESALRNHDDIAMVEQQNLMKVRKYKRTFADPEFPNQWHLFNEKVAVDCNVTNVWDYDVVGQGVVVAIVDEGVDWRHQDLKYNYFREGSYDFINDDKDPTPLDWNQHGTQAAGVIAAGDNSLCGVGVAYRSKFSGIDILSGGTTNAKTAEALNYQMRKNHIYSNSWGPSNDGKTAENLHWLIGQAFILGAKTGRGSYGSIFVFAAGNGGDESDNCNYNGYASSKYVIPITAVTEYGVTPTYGERCNTIMASTVSGPYVGSNNDAKGKNGRNITTTDNMNGCSSQFTGTSASASIASGIIALMLQVRPCLYWRDVHHIIAMTSSHVTLSGEIDLYHQNESVPSKSLFDTNEAGYTYNDYHGFGLLDAWKLVNAARVWKSVPNMRSFQPKCKNATSHRITLNQPLELSCIPDNTGEVSTIESVVLTFSIKHEYRGMLEYVITCPSGTESVIATRPLDTSQKGLQNFVFRTVKCWGESASGEYKLKIRDTRKVGNTTTTLTPGRLGKWEMTVYGSEMSKRDLLDRWNVVKKSYSDGGSRLDEKFKDSPSNCPSGISPIIVVILILVAVIIAFGLLWMIYLAIRHHKKKKQQIKPAPSETASITDKTMESQHTRLSMNISKKSNESPN